MNRQTFPVGKTPVMSNQLSYSHVCVIIPAWDSLLYKDVERMYNYFISTLSILILLPCVSYPGGSSDDASVLLDSCTYYKDILFQDGQTHNVYFD